ncbi:hypothetical protein MC378_03185 [Polaribacter sp. MSW13]|uniref:Uncharacterized protein n=1 Tax=Polaribacter marinus TaxID=2916838 RepID=A0A9X1VM89_9FLAO|nr:hypothetical protein [Polaribacter marinus]MCI2228158.1 hypothetical protein [Polaribacter marinus]
MDLGTIIIGVVGITLCAIPFVVTNRIKKKKEKELLNSLQEIAKQNDCEISDYETCGCYAIGIDTPKKAISFVSRTDEGYLKQQFVDLSTIKKCEIANISRSSSGNSIDKLNLNFTPIAKNSANSILEFYNSKINYQLSGEYQSIEKWNKLINSIL